MNRRRFLKAAMGVAGAALVLIPTPSVQAASLGQITPDHVRRRLDRRLRSGLRQRLAAQEREFCRTHGRESFNLDQVRDLIAEIDAATRPITGR